MNHEQQTQAEPSAQPSVASRAAPFMVGPLAEPKPVLFAVCNMVDGLMNVNAYTTVAAGAPLANEPLYRSVMEMGRWLMGPQTASALAENLAANLDPQSALELGERIIANARTMADAQSHAAQTLTTAN